MTSLKESSILRACGFLVENHRAVAQGHYIQILGHIDVAFNAHGLVMTVEHIGQRTLYLLVIHDGIKAFDHDKDGADRHGKVLGVDPVAGVHPRFGRRINAGIPLQSAVGFQVVAIGQSLAVFWQDFVNGATVLMQLYGVILVFDGQTVSLILREILGGSMAVILPKIAPKPYTKTGGSAICRE